MNAHVYPFVEMGPSPPSPISPGPAELVTFMERHDPADARGAGKAREQSGRILAGGTTLAAVGLSFIIRVDSPQELEDAVASLPLWPRAQTRVLPLGTFAARVATARQRLAQLKDA